MNGQTHITISVYRGWVVTCAGGFLGLVFGILYVWSVIKSGIPAGWGWTHADKALPYSVMAVCFAVIMVPAGQLQDRFGPKPVVCLGGFLAGLGCIVSGFGGSSLAAYVLGFGVITGAGVGFGYSALTPAAIKWFPSEKTGLVAGIVVAGSGLAPVPMAPLTHWLLQFFSRTVPGHGLEMGVSATMITLGIWIWVAVTGIVWFIYNPPLTYTPDSMTASPSPRSHQTSLSAGKMIATPQFWLLYLMYFSGASAGLVFISVAADLGKQALGTRAFLTVVFLSVGNTLGRILAGTVSDKIGRQQTLALAFTAQALTIFGLYLLSGVSDAFWGLILLMVFSIGMNYGANLTIFPAVCKEYFGMRNFGVNYGMLFTSFGMAGLAMPWLNGFIRDMTGKPDLSYGLIVILLVLSVILSLISLKLGIPCGSRVQNKKGAVK